jgi:hypothetical protein
MDTPLTFIVRIYRRAQGRLTGVVEDVQGSVRSRFSNPEELWEAIVRRGIAGDREFPGPKDDSSE